MKTGPEIREGVAKIAYDARCVKANKLMKKEVSEALYVVMAEVLFILLPFLVIGMVFYFRGKWSELFSQPEWALAASVISGQAVVKLICGFLSTPMGRIAWQKISLGITFVIVLCLTPSLLVLTLILNAERTSRALIKTQVCFFLVGLVIFILFNWAGEGLRAWGKFKQETATARRQDTPREIVDEQPSNSISAIVSSGNGNGGTQADWNQFIEEKARKSQPNSQSRQIKV
jgi:hypothetical protein